MQPGRELDAKVAEAKELPGLRQVEGYAEYIQGRDWAYVGDWVYTPDPSEPAAEVPYFSTSIAAAWPLLAEHTDADVEKAGLNYHVTLSGWASASALTAEHAICLAYLKYKGIDLPSN